MLERIRAGDKPRRAELRFRLSEHVQETRLRTALRLSAAADQDKGSTEATLEEYKPAFQEDPSDVRVAFALERALRQAGDFAGLAWLYSRRLEVVTEPIERVELLLRIADLSEHKLGDLERAGQLYRAALEAQPQCLPALRARAACSSSRATSPRPAPPWRPRPAPAAIPAAPWRPSSPPRSSPPPA